MNTSESSECRHAVDNLSTSESSEFKRCRQMWHFSSYRRRALVPVGLPSDPLWYGTLIHIGVEALRKGKSPAMAMTSYAVNTIERIEEEFEQPIEQGVRYKVQDDVILSRRIVEHYAVHYEEEHDWLYEGWRALRGTEELSFRIPLPGTDGGFLTGTFDVLAVDQHGRLWVVDIKTFDGNPPAWSQVVLREQFSAYLCAAAYLVGVRNVGGLLYDGVRRSVPKKPAVTKSKGKVSKAAITTTWVVYKQALIDNGQDPEDEEYADIQTQIKKQQFFCRHKVHFNPHMVEKWRWDFTKTYNDIQRAPHIYPSFQIGGCWDCAYQDLCAATQLGEDVEMLIQERYRRRGSYGSATGNRWEDAIIIGGMEDLLALEDVRPNSNTPLVATR